jgi:hypothetical protein
MSYTVQVCYDHSIAAPSRSTFLGLRFPKEWPPEWRNTQVTGVCGECGYEHDKHRAPHSPACAEGRR